MVTNCRLPMQAGRPFEVLSFASASVRLASGTMTDCGLRRLRDDSWLWWVCMLCRVSGSELEHLRAPDVAGRHGGDEFV